MDKIVGSSQLGLKRSTRTIQHLYNIRDTAAREMQRLDGDNERKEEQIYRIADTLMSPNHFSDGIWNVCSGVHIALESLQTSGGVAEKGLFQLIKLP